MHGSRVAWTFGVATVAWLGGGNASATIPYTPVGAGAGYPGLGAGLITPDKVFGKEYSHDLDENTTGAGGVPDPHQVIAWDGIGGTADGLDFSPPILPTPLVDHQIDALANHDDAFFNELIADDSHLIFSLDKEFTIYTPGAGPSPAMLPEGTPPGVLLKNGNLIGGSGEISYELGTFGGANGPEVQGLWADQATINGMPLPIDVDGLEVWGPEPALTADSDKFSLRLDAGTGFAGPPVSVWNGDGTPYILLPVIEAAVTALLGDLPTHIEPDLLNLDALMVSDVVGEDTDFGRDPFGGGDLDAIIFSIDQIVDPLDADGFYATGSELFVLDAAGGVTYLDHGGHLWDHAYALATFSFGAPLQQNYGVFDIDAIETVSEFVVPEPATAALLLTGLTMMITRRRAA